MEANEPGNTTTGTHSAPIDSEDTVTIERLDESTIIEFGVKSEVIEVLVSTATKPSGSAPLVGADSLDELAIGDQEEQQEEQTAPDDDGSSRQEANQGHNPSSTAHSASTLNADENRSRSMYNENVLDSPDCPSQLSWFYSQLHGMLDKAYVGDWECCVCSQPFRCLNRLMAHLTAHGPQDRYVCCVASCDTHFDTVHQLNLHMMDHPPPKHIRRPRVKQATKSKKPSSKRKALRQRQNTRRFVCDRTGPDGRVCGDTFTRLFTIERHYARKHGEYEAMVACDVCARQFKTIDNLRAHQRTMSHYTK